MGKLLYYDGSVAVCEFEHEEFRSDKVREETVKLLLSYAAAPSEETFKKLLSCAGIPWLTLAVVIVPNNRTDKHALELLGVHFSDAEEHKEGSFLLEYDDDFGVNKVCFPIDVTRSRVEYLSADMALLSKLFLLAKGETKHEGILRDVKIDAHKGVSVALDTPSHTGGTVTEEYMFSFDNLGCIGAEGSNVFIVTSHTSTSDKVFTPKATRSSPYFPNSESEQKRMLAGRVLAELLNKRSGKRYGWDNDNGLVDSVDDGYSDTLALAIRDGKIRACPWCGCPILLPRKSSKPFCRPSHQTRYSEKAREAFSNGESVDEVAEAFPYIQRATIANWQH